jgi:hypothetical protein
MDDSRTGWSSDQLRALPLECLDERLQRYRLIQPRRERMLADSPRRYGQLAPIVVCLHQGDYVLIDGFKRLHPARSVSVCRYWKPAAWMWMNKVPRRQLIT